MEVEGIILGRLVGIRAFDELRAVAFVIDLDVFREGIFHSRDGAGKENAFESAPLEGVFSERAGNARRKGQFGERRGFAKTAITAEIVFRGPVEDESAKGGKIAEYFGSDDHLFVPFKNDAFQLFASGKCAVREIAAFGFDQKRTKGRVAGKTVVDDDGILVYGKRFRVFDRGVE